MPKTGVFQPRATRITPAIKAEFVRIYAETGVLNTAAVALGIDRHRFIGERKTDPEFDDAVKRAYQQFQDTLEAEVLTVAREGREEDVFYMGVKMPDKKRVHSDRILELAAKRHIAEYRDKITADVNVSGGLMIVPGVAASVAEWQKENGSDDDATDD